MPGGNFGGCVAGRSTCALKTISSEFLSGARVKLPLRAAGGEPKRGGRSDGGGGNSGVASGGPLGGGVVGTMLARPILPKTESLESGDASECCEHARPGGCDKVLLCCCKENVSALSNAPKLMGASKCKSTRRELTGCVGLSGEKGGGFVGVRTGVTSNVSSTDSFGESCIT